MDARRLPAAVLAAAGDRRGGAAEVAATALDGLLEVAGDRDLLEEAAATLLAGQPAMAPIWHLARAARGPDPATALADLRRHLTADADAAVTAATAWLRRHLSDHPGAVATVSHSSLVDRVLAHAEPVTRPGPETQAGPAFSVWRWPPRWGSLADREGEGVGLSTAPSPVVGVVGADAVGPGGVLNAVGTRGLAERLPTLVVATAIKLVPEEVFERLAGPGFEVVPLDLLAAVVVGPDVLSPAEAGRRAEAVSRGRP
jgi:translation initiation factor 2B subunit (eIF-2B alpha/beta/delta family)